MGIPLLGAIAGGVASLIGGALDNKRAKKNRQAEEARLRAATGYDFVKLRDQATAAGFSPLTVLQATGGAGYDGRGAVVSQPYSPFIQGALTGAVSSYFDLRESDRRFALDVKRDEILSREIDRIGGAFGGTSAFGAPSAVMAGSAGYVAPSVFDQTKPNRRGGDLYTLGEKVITDTGTSSAQAFSDQYGDWVGDAYGLRNWVWDQWSQLKREAAAMPIVASPEKIFGNGQGAPAVAPNRALVWR